MRPTRNHFRSVLLVMVCFVFGLIQMTPSAQAQQKRPNIVMLMTDDTGD